jgi:hypothetical protein
MTRAMRSRWLRAAVGLAAAGVLAFGNGADAAGGGTARYSAPFRIGPTGGDQFSYHDASSQGTITVGRVYPIPGAINCTKGAPYAKLLIQHKAVRPVKKIVLSYDSAAVDNFTFLMLGLRNGNHWIGSTTVRGVLTGSGTVTLRPPRRQGNLPRLLTIEFGLQQSSACPNADAGTLHISRVEVSS